MPDRIEGKHCRLVLSEKRHGTKARENQRAKAPHGYIHDITNQLTVINLCCFRLRDLLSEKLNVNQSRELETIEIAVAEAAELLDRLSRSLKATSPVAGVERSAANPLRPSATTTAGVYRISPDLKPRR